MPKVSIIIVQYKNKDNVTNLVNSIRKSKPKNSYEIIIVDNSIINRGYSKGNNLGVKKASGKYILILNPDTIVQNNSIDKLVNFIEKNKNVGIVAPTLIDKTGKAYEYQGTKDLTPIRGVFALSFINRLFPNNKISKDYWLGDTDRSKKLEVDVVPGTAFMITKDLFNKVNGFDEEFFLYFEESDFCKRIKKLKYKLFIIADSKITHLWGKILVVKSSLIKADFIILKSITV